MSYCKLRALPYLKVQIIKTEAIAGIIAAYLNINKAHVTAKAMVEKGTIGISAEKSVQAAQTILKLKSKLGIDDEEASQQAGKLTQQKAKYINRKNAVNKSPWNIFQTTLLDNQNSEIDGNFQIKTQYLFNQDAKLKLGAETSSIVAGKVFSSPKTEITGNGNLLMEISGDHQEKSSINMGGTYQLKATRIDVKTKLAAKNASFHATHGNIALANGASIIVEEAAELDGVSVDNKGKIRGDTVMIHQKFYRDPGDVTAKHYLEYSSDSHMALNRSMTTEGDFALKSEVGIDVNQPLNVGGKGILETAGKVNLNAQTVFKKGTNVKAHEVDINADMHITGPSVWKCNRVNLNAKAGDSQRSRYGFLRRRGRYASTNFHHHGDLDWDVKDTLIDGSNMHVKGKMLLKGVMRVVSRMHTETYEKEVGKVKSKKWGGLKKTSKTLYATCTRIVTDLFAVLQVEDGLYIDNGSVIIEGGAFLGKLAKGHANKISVGIQSLPGESPTSIPPFQKAPGLPTPHPGGYWGTTGTTSLTVDDFYVNGNFESTQGKVNVAAKKFLVECRVAEKDEQVATISRSGGIHRHTVKSDDAQPGGYVHGALGAHIHIEESGVLRGGTVSSNGITRFTGKHLTEEPVVLRKVVHLKPGRKSFFKHFSGGAQMREMAGEQLIKNKRLPGMPKTPVNMDPFSFFRKVRAWSERREYVPSHIAGKAVIIDLDGNFNTTASHVTGLDGVIIRAANISKRELFDSYKSETSQRGKGKREIQTVTVTEGSIRAINGPVVLDANKGDLYLEGEVGSFNGHVTLKAVRDISLITRSESAENKVSTTTYSFPRVTHQRHTFNSVTISRARVFGTGLTIDAGRNLITEAPDVDIAGDASIKAKYWERRGHKINLHHRTKETSVGVKFFGSEAIAAAVNERKPLRTAEELFKEDPALNNFCHLVGGSKDGVAAAKTAVITAALGWNALSRYSKAFNNGGSDGLLNSLGYDHGLTDKEGNFKPKITIQVGASQNNARWTQTIPAEFHIRGHYKEDVNVVRDNGAQFDIGGDAEINNDLRILDSEMDTFNQSGMQGTAEVGYGASGWSFGGSYAQSSAKGKTHTPHRMIVGGDLRMKVWDLRLNNSAYIEAEHVFLKVHKLSGETVGNTYRQKGFSGSASSDERASFSASSTKRYQVADVMTIKSRQPGHITADTVYSKGGLFQNVTFNPDAKLHFEDVKEYNKTLTISAQYFGKDTQKSSKDEEEGIKVWGDVDLDITSQKGKVRATIAGGNGEAFPGINTDIDRHHTKGKDRKLHLGVPIMTFDPDILEANAQEISRAFGFSQPPAPPPVVNDMPKMLPKLIVKKSMPKIAENTSSKTLQEPPQPQEKAKKEAAQPKPKTQEVEPKKTAEKTPPPAEKRTQKPAKAIASPKTAEEKALEEMYSKIGAYRIQGMTDINRLAMPLYAMDYVAELAIGKFIDMSKDNSLSGRIQWHMMMSSLLMPSPSMQAAYTLYPLLEHKLTDLSNKSGLTDFVGKFLADCEKDISDDWKNRKGVIGFAAKAYSEYQDYIERQVVLNRKFNIPDVNTRQYYADLTKIGEAAVFAGAVGAGAKLLKVARPLMTRQGIKTFLREDSGAVPLLERVFKLTAQEESYLPAPYSPTVQKFVDKMNTVVEKHAPEGRTLSTSLDRVEEEIASAIRNVAYFGNERLKVWSGMIQERGVVDFSIDFIENPIFKELPSFKPKGDFIAKVDSKEGFSAIIKQKRLGYIIQEASGLDTFRPFQTKYLQTPEILDIGQYLGKIVLMTTRLPGDPIALWMKNIGSHGLGTPERGFLFQHLVKVSHQLGKEGGKLQTKGLKQGHWQQKDFSGRAAGIEEGQKGVNRLLKDMNLKQIDVNPGHLQSLVTDLEKSPETLTFGFGRIRDHHFLVSPENTSVGFIGAGNIPFTVNALKKPNVFPADEFYSFLGLFDKGIRYGLTPKEADILKRSFMQGHASTFSGEVTNASQQFFNLSAQTDTLLELGDAFNKGIIKDKAVIGKFVDQLNHSIKPSEMSPNSWTTLARDFLKDDVGGGELPPKKTSAVAKEISTNNKPNVEPASERTPQPAQTKNSPLSSFAKVIKDFLRDDKGGIELLPDLSKSASQNKNLSPTTHHPAVQKVLDDISSVVVKQAEGETRLDAVLCKSEREISKLVPDVSHLGENPEQVWAAMIQEARGLPAQDFKIEYYNINPLVNSGRSYNAKLQSTSDGFTAVIKQKEYPFFIGEIEGLDTLVSLGLEDLQVPRILALGKYEGKYILVKTHLKGNTVTQWQKNIGIQESRSTPRHLSTLDLAKGCRQGGKGIGELASKGQEHGLVKDLEIVTVTVGNIEKGLVDANARLKDLSLPKLKVSSRYLKSLGENLKNSPESCTYVLADDHGKQFILSPKDFSFGYIDAEGIPSMLNPSKKPIGFAAQGFYNFLGVLDQGICHGLSLKETQMLKDAFIEGFYSKFPGQLSDASQQFFSLNANVRTVLNLVRALNSGTIKDKTIVEQFINQLNRSIKTHEKPERKWVKWGLDFLKDDVGGGELLPKAKLTRKQTKALHPTAVQKFIGEVNNVIEQHASHASCLNNAFLSADVEIAKIFPNFSHLGKSQEQVWSALANKGKPVTAEPKIEYYKDDYKQPIAKVESNGSSAVIKEFGNPVELLGEVSALDILGSHELQHLQVSRLLAVGKYDMNRYVLAKTHIEGETFGVLMQEVGTHAVGTIERRSALNELTKASVQAGKGIGELQSKAMKYKDNPSLHVEKISFSKGCLDGMLKTINKMLGDLKLRKLDDYSSYIDSLAINFEKDPGLITYSLGDIHSNQFIWSKKSSSLGYIDAVHVCDSIDLLKKPRSFAAKDFYEFLSIYDIEGLALGLTLEETQMLKESFKEGFFSEFSGNFTPASQQFFDFYSSTSALKDLAESLIDGIPTDRKLIKRLVNQINGKITAIPPTDTPIKKWTTTAKEFLKDDIGGLP